MNLQCLPSSWGMVGVQKIFIMVALPAPIWAQQNQQFPFFNTKGNFVQPAFGPPKDLSRHFFTKDGHA